jgi:GTP-binding protein
LIQRWVGAQDAGAETLESEMKSMGVTTKKTELPLITIVGRPNVGKSTLFNRLTGTRRAIVTDEPGITRDRIYGKSRWEGRPFDVVDTGGIVQADKAEIPVEILRQARKAIEEAACVVQVVDARAGVTPLDLELALLLRRAGKSPIIAANKVDMPQQAGSAAAFYELSENVIPISAEHGFGVDELLDTATANFPAVEETPGEPEIRVAIIGRPNVGKSTLLNRLAGSERSIVSENPGTTRDTVDELVEHNGKVFRFLDTAGIRRKGKTTLTAEKLSVVTARKHLEQADVALLVMDAGMGVTTHDARIAGYAEESGCSVILVMNKWDLATEASKQQKIKQGKRPSESLLLRDYEKLVRSKLKALDYAPVVVLSALTGERAGKLFDLVERVGEARKKRISTGELNRWLESVDLQRGSSPAGREFRIYYITQGSTAPPTFVLFTNLTKPMHFSYRRFLENELRKKFEFSGAPLRFVLRLKKKRRMQWNETED